MEIRIIISAENDAFNEYDFDNEIRKVLKQAEDILTDKSHNEKLLDSNGNIVGSVWRSTAIRPRKNWRD